MGEAFASLVKPSSRNLSVIIDDVEDRSHDKLITPLQAPTAQPACTVLTPSVETSSESTLSPGSDPNAILAFYGQLAGDTQVDEITQLQALSKLSIWHLRALANLKKRLQDRKLELLDYRFSNANDDAQPELIAQSKGQSGNKETWLVGVYSINGDSSLKLRYEYAQSVANDKYSTGQLRYEQSIKGLQRGFSLCEAWQADTWIIHECNDIILDETWQAYVLKQRIENREKNSLTSQMTAFDFANRIAERDYTRIPTGPFMPVIKRQSGFAMIYAYFEDRPSAEKTRISAQANPIVPSPNAPELAQRVQYVVHKHTLAAGQAFAPIAIQARYNEMDVKIDLWVQDENLVTLPQCSDNAAIQQADHVALWFDLNPDPSIQEKPESWMLEFQKAYRINPFRHELDEDIVGIAITSDSCIVPLTQHHKMRPKPQIQAELIPNGYHIEVSIPAGFFGVERLSQLDRAQGISFSAVQHNITADRDHFFTQATSQWQWPDPFSFGQIWLLPQNPSPLPKYPLIMENWLSDH